MAVFRIFTVCLLAIFMAASANAQIIDALTEDVIQGSRVSGSSLDSISGSISETVLHRGFEACTDDSPGGCEVAPETLPSFDQGRKTSTIISRGNTGAASDVLSGGMFRNFLSTNLAAQVVVADVAMQMTEPAVATGFQAARNYAELAVNNSYNATEDFHRSLNADNMRADVLKEAYYGCIRRQVEEGIESWIQIENTCRGGDRIAASSAIPDPNFNDGFDLSEHPSHINRIGLNEPEIPADEADELTVVDHLFNESISTDTNLADLREDFLRYAGDFVFQINSEGGIYRDSSGRFVRPDNFISAPEEFERIHEDMWGALLTILERRCRHSNGRYSAEINMADYVPLNLDGVGSSCDSSGCETTNNEIRPNDYWRADPDGLKIGSTTNPSFFDRLAILEFYLADDTAQDIFEMYRKDFGSVRNDDGLVSGINCDGISGLRETAYSGPAGTPNLKEIFNSRRNATITAGVRNSRPWARVAWALTRKLANGKVWLKFLILEEYIKRAPSKTTQDRLTNKMAMELIYNAARVSGSLEDTYSMNLKDIHHIVGDVKDFLANYKEG